MPELPEVETIRRVLAAQVLGKNVSDVYIYNVDVISHPSADVLRTALIGCAFSAIRRRGKYLRFITDDGSEMILHLRMTGRPLIAPVSLPPEPHTHLIIKFSDGSEFRYIDPRRFGRFWLICPGEDLSVTGIDRLGPEPFDAAVDAAYLAKRLSQSRRAVKTALLDQSVVAGIGNIYSDEILFSANIHPARPCGSLSAQEWERLAAAIPASLSFYIDMNEITPEDYLATGGKEYRNTPYLKMYGRAGSACSVCGTLIERRVIGGRSTCFCPHCQPENGL